MVEALEGRQLLSSVFAVTDNNRLLEFDTARPGTIVRSLPITGLRAGEVMATIDFNSVTEQLYGVPSGSHTPVYTIDRLTGAATRVGPGVPFGFPLDKATGLDYDELHGYFRYIDESYGNYRLDPVLGIQLRNDAGQEGLAEIAYRPLNGDAANFGFFGVNYITDEFMQLDPEGMSVLGGGALGVDIEKFVGLDITPGNTTLLSVRVAGVTRLGTIGADGHSFVDMGMIGDGATVIRGIASAPTAQAPVIDGALAPLLMPINQDDAGNGGTLVRDLIGSTGVRPLISDGSPGAVQGIAVTSVDLSAGSWRFSLDGFNWASLDGASGGAAVLLPADGSARVRLLPRAGFSGSVAQGLRFRAWDQLAGFAGQSVDTGDGGAAAGALSAGEAWASIEVLPVHHPPTVILPQPSGGTFAISDKQTVNPFALGVIGYADNPAQTLSVRVSISDAGHGKLTAESLLAAGFAVLDERAGVYGFSGTAAAATAALRQLVFRPNENLAPVGQQSATVFTVVVEDALGAQALALSPYVASRSVRDEPRVTMAGAGASITDKQTVTPFLGAVIDAVDVGKMLTVDVDAGASGTFTSESLAAAGFAAVPGGGVYRFTGSAEAAGAALRVLVFRARESLGPVGSTAHVFLKVLVSDGQGPAVEGSAAEIAVLSVNDAPTISGLTAANLIKVNKVVRAFRSLVIGDVDAGEVVRTDVRLSAPAKGLISVQTLRASGFVKIGNGRYRFTGSAAAATAAIRKLKFAWSPALNTGAAQQVKLKVLVTDAAGAQLVNNQTYVRLKA